MFVHQDDEGTVNIFTNDERLAELMELEGYAGHRTLVYFTGAPNAGSATVLCNGYRAIFKHEGDLEFEVGPNLNARGMSYEIRVSKKVAPF